MVIGGLSYAAASTNKVTCGSASMLDNLNQGTVLTWLQAAANGGDICSKYNNVSTGWEQDFPSGNPRIRIRRATTAQSASSEVCPLNVPLCVACSWDLTNGNPKVYWGAGGEVLRERTTSPVNGSGNISNDASLNYVIGNSDSGSNSGTKVVWFHIIWDRVMTLDALQAVQFNPRPLFSPRGCWRLGSDVTSSLTVNDESGWDNHGTITGAVLANQALAFPMEGDDEMASEYKTLIAARHIPKKYQILGQAQQRAASW